MPTSLATPPSNNLPNLPVWSAPPRADLFVYAAKFIDNALEVYGMLRSDVVVVLANVARKVHAERPA